MERREFSFTLSGDIYIRYLSFKDHKELSRALEQKTPVKMDVGAVYNVNPAVARKGLAAMHPEERELVFDIDMTDYDDVRTCCQGAEVCKMCWRFLAIACKILDRVLTSHFGFKHLLWVFSGRRGLHCWVCDEEARCLSMDERAAIVEYLSLVDGGKFMTKKCRLDRQSVHHPLVRDALAVLDSPADASGLTLFEKIVVEEQKQLETPKQWRQWLCLCGSKLLMEQISSAVEGKKKSLDKVRQMMGVCNKFEGTNGNNVGAYFMREMKLQFCYPRLDVNVSKGLNHLLKSPFVVHPKTGRICVPFNPKHVDSFDPKAVPLVSHVVEGFEAGGKGDGKGCLASSLDLLEKFVASMESERLKRE